jgi:uncharacterized protein
MMRFSGERPLGAPVAAVWATLHDPDALRVVVPGCTGLVPLAGCTYAATLEARVGPVADTYRGSFTIEDLCQGSRLRVLVRARGRLGRLGVDLDVGLVHGPPPGTTVLRYDARAAVGGVVSRLGRATLTVAGSHFTGCFFRDLDRSLRRAHPARELAQLS